MPWYLELHECVEGRDLEDTYRQMWTFDTKDEALAHARTLNLRRNYGAIVYRSPSDRPLPLPGQVTSQPD